MLSIGVDGLDEGLADVVGPFFAQGMRANARDDGEVASFIAGASLAAIFAASGASAEGQGDGGSGGGRS